MSESVREQLLNLGMQESEIDNHRSDLYVLKNDISEKFVTNDYEFKENVTTFKDAIDGLIWYEIPFAYYEESDNEPNLKKQLREMKQNSDSELTKAVITDLLSQGDNEEIESYIKDLLEHGCVSGMVSGLIYYNDTDKFFIMHHDEILEMLEEAKNDCGIGFEINSNNLAWFAYEEICQKIASDLGLEY